MSSITVVADAGQAVGRFGGYGGRYEPESLIPACQAVADAFAQARGDPGFRGSLSALLSAYAGRPTPLMGARRLSEELGVTILLKREDLTHTGSHKINNVLGQALLAKRMGRKRLIAETGAGMHGVAVATAGGRIGGDARRPGQAVHRPTGPPRLRDLRTRAGGRGGGGRRRSHRRRGRHAPDPRRRRPGRGGRLRRGTAGLALRTGRRAMIGGDQEGAAWHAIGQSPRISPRRSAMVITSAARRCPRNET